MTASITDLQSSQSATPHSRVATPPNRWKTRIALPGLILAAMVVLLAITASEILLPATPVRVIPVMVKTTQGSAGSVTVQAPGWLEPDPHPYYASALATGVVEQILVLEGEPVKAGQIVARLVADDARLALRRKQAEVEQREAEVEVAQADLKAATAALENLVEPRRAVATAQARMARIDAELVKSAADLSAEQATLEQYRDEHQRKANLIESGAVAEAVVARLELKIQTQQGVVDATAAQRSVLEANGSDAAAQLHAAEENLRLLIEETQAVERAQANLNKSRAALALAQSAREEAALRLERMQVRSPLAGIVMRRLASPGSKLMFDGAEHSMHVLHVYDPVKLQVRVDVPLSEAASVGVGQQTEIIVEVLPDRVFAGVVTRVVHEADIQKNTVEVKVAVSDPDATLKPEMLARVRFLATHSAAVDDVRQRLFAPRSLVQSGGDGQASVLVAGDLVDQRGRVVQRSVTAGSTTIDDWVEIESGLRVGDKLIVDPSGTIGSGDRIRVIGEQQSLAGAGA